MVIQFRRGNPSPSYVLKDAEPGWDTETETLKMGNGVEPWADRPQIIQSTDVARIQKITQAEYDALPTPRPSTTLYVITP